jgi:hypothetical protein
MVVPALGAISAPISHVSFFPSLVGSPMLEDTVTSQLTPPGVMLVPSRVRLRGEGLGRKGHSVPW